MIKTNSVGLVYLLIQIFMLQSAPLYSRLCQPVESKLLRSLRNKQEYPFIETATLMERIEKEACPGQEKKVVEKVVGFLDESGEVR